jgi:hypothetical protein
MGISSLAFIKGGEMRIHLPFFALGLLTLLFFAGCTAVSSPASTHSPTEDIPATQEYERNLVATILSNRRTEEALEKTIEAQQETLEARQMLGLTATQDAVERQKTLEAQATQSAAWQATNEARAERIATQSAARETEQVGPVYEIVERLFADGTLSTTEGRYHRLDDFDQSWAQIDWYQWWRTGLVMENFVVRVDAEWESASKYANWFTSGCGFVFSEKSAWNHYASFLALDGNVYNSRVRDNIGTLLPGGYFGRLDVPAGSAELVLVVDQKVVSFYVNGKRVSRYTDNSITKGDFSLTLNSGTNLDYGTRCKMKNIDVWELK